MTGRRIGLHHVLAGCFGAMGTLSPVWAQETAPARAADSSFTEESGGAGEIVVTAQRRQELSRDVPITLTTLGAEQIEQAGVSELSDIARLTPGLRFDSAFAFVQPTIRGVGTAVSASGGGSNVGLYIDGFYNPNPAAMDIDLMRVKSIQVLKGPQGTLFGRNTTGGAILINTAEPSVKTGGTAEISYGRFDALRARSYVTAGLTETVAVDIEGQYRRGDGYATNIVDGADDVGRYRNWTLRTGIKADVTADFSILARYIHSQVNDPQFNMGNPHVTPDGTDLVLPFLLNSGLYSTRPGDVAITQRVGSTSNSDTGQLTLRYDLGAAELTSYTQYREDLSDQRNDFDFTAAPVFLANLQIRNKTVTQELLLASKGAGPLQWTAGLFYFQNSDGWEFGDGSTNPTTPITANGTKTRSYAAYVDLTYAVTPEFFLTAGGRYGRDDISDAFFLSVDPATFGQRFDVPDYKKSSFSPRFVARYKPNARSSVYASFSQGYKSGILNVGGAQFTPVRPEKIKAYEVGYKYDDRVFGFEVSGFYYDYKNLQVSTYFNNSANIENAANSEIYGVDAQFHMALSDAFRINGGANYTHARYLNFANATSYCISPTAPCAATAGFLGIVPVSVQDGRMQRTPAFTGNLGASYVTPLADGKLTLSTNLYYTSSFYFDPVEQFREPAYEVLALRAEWTDPSDRFSLAVFGDNVTGSRYRTQLFTNSTGIGNTWSTPATYGVSARVNF